MKAVICLACLLLLHSTVRAFISVPAALRMAPCIQQQHHSQGGRSVSRIEMGRRSEKIARTKEKGDMKRTKQFARMGKKIMQAVRAGGPDEETNKQLADAMKEAKSVNVPKENIMRAVKKASEDKNAATFKELTYEAYGHGGVGLMISCLTDNTNRAGMEISTVLKKEKLGELASMGSVQFKFTLKGRFVTSHPVTEDQAIEAAISADVDEVEVVDGDEEGVKYVLTDPTAVAAVADALGQAVGATGTKELCYVPNTLVSVSDEDLEDNLRVIDLLEGLEDVEIVDHDMAVEDDGEEE